MISPIAAIVKKDLKGFLTNPMFYFLTGLCCCLWGAFFAFSVYSFVQGSYQMSQQAVNAGINIHQHLIANYVVIVHYVLVFIIAAFSLRYFAEEKKMKTFPILLSSPMTSWQIVLAKWITGASVIFILLFVSALFPLSLLFFIKIPLGLLSLAYFGAFVILCAYMSASLLVSSMTESLIVCVVLTLVFNIFLLLMGVGSQFTDSQMLQGFFQFLSIDQHFSSFRTGVFSLSSLLYFLSLSFLFSFMTERVIEFHRWR